jgi:HTH-type transcriptional regulator / antitoxin HigA
MMKAKKEYGFEPDYAIAPGETLKEVMESMEMTQRELATRCGLTVQSLNRIFKGDQPISYETANSLELVTAVPASFWNNLEAQYREQLAKLEEHERLEGEKAWLRKLPCKELVERGHLTNQTDKTLMVREALSFFSVSSVSAWHELWEQPKVAARRSTCFESHPERTAAWLRMGEIEAHKCKCKTYDKQAFQKALKKIKAFTKEAPETFLPAVQKLCANSGVALVLVQDIPKVRWNGATKWLTPNKPMIILSLRGKREDKFWFTFFHEAGHILHDGKKGVFINDGKAEDERERKADAFAANFLIPTKYDKDIKVASTEGDIKVIANKLNISKGIVAGRYQHLTKKWSYFNNLIRKFEWAE